MCIISEECASTWGHRNHGPQHPGSPPTLGTSAAPTGATPATRTSSPASRPSAAILTTHVTGGGRGRRVRKGRGLTPSARRPGPVKSRALRPGCDWARYLEALIGFEEGRTPVGPPPARPSSPASAICEPGSLVLASRGKRGPVLAHECGCAGFSSGHLR